MFYVQDLLMLMWPQEMEKFKWRTTGKAKCDTMCCLFKANEEGAQQLHTMNCLYQPSHNFKFPALVIFWYLFVLSLGHSSMN